MARVLIVDDERGMRTTLQEFLRDAHYEVGMAADAAQALAKLAAEDFDVVLTDIIMPRITGVKLLEAIREKSPNAQVLLMTGEPTVETASQAVRAGAFDYLTKPIGKEQLLKSVANAVKLKTLDDERQRLAKENQQYQENLERLVEERSAALHQSEERYRTLAESAQDLIYSIDRQWEVQYANRAAIAFFGENVVGKPLQELFPPEAFKRMKKDVQSVFAAGTPVSTVSKLSSPDREIWLETQFVALSSGTAGTHSVMGISRDITERKQAEETLAHRHVAMEALYMTSLEINTQPDLTALLQSIVQRAASLLRTQQGSLSLLQPHGRTLKQVTPHNFELPFTYPDQALGEGLAGRVAHSGEMLMISDYASWEGRLPIPEMNGRIVGVPLKRGEQVIGVLEVWDADETGTFDTEEVQLLSMFANQAAGAIENARLFEAEQEQRALAEALRETAETLSALFRTMPVISRWSQPTADWS